MCSVVQDMSNHPRFKIGREAGQLDRSSEIASDMPYFNQEIERMVDAKFVGYRWIDGTIITKSFADFDPAYVQGYDQGYQEGLPKLKKNKK